MPAFTGAVSTGSGSLEAAVGEPRERRAAEVLRRHGDLDPLAADARLELGRRPGDDAAVVEDDDVVARRSASSRYWVVRKRRAVVDELAQELPQLVPAAGSRPVVGSSRNSTGGAATSWPPGRAGAACRRRTSSPAGRPARQPSARAARRRAARHRRGRWYRRPTSSRLARAVSRPSTVPAWPATPILVAHGGRVGHDVEAVDRAVPVVGRASVVRMRIAVVLPAPLWPSRPRTVPAGTWRSRSRSAHRSSKRLPSPSATIPLGDVFVRCMMLSYIVRASY